MSKARNVVKNIQLIHIMFFLIVASTVLYIFLASRNVETITQKKKVLLEEGLSIKNEKFTMQGQNFTILSGAIHYFRVPTDYWDDRLIKLKGMGLNTVETYIPWNLHEPHPGEFNFEDNLSIVDFVHLAQMYGIFVILRPGPYICAEWDLGGLPSWLLRDPEMQLRSSYKPFLDAVDRYFGKLLPMLARLQFSKGGPVIAFQIENEYGSYGSDLHYLRHLKESFRKHGISELLFVSDNEGGLGRAHLKDTLQTVNFQTGADAIMDKLKQLQPKHPIFVTEFWSGWFDHWGEKHHKVKIDVIEKSLISILTRGASVNFYMFHGGTNFGFMNGANTYSKGYGYNPTVSSYDYDAPVSETGDLTDKYHALKKIIQQYAPKGSVPDKLEEIPQPSGRFVPGPILFTEYMPLRELLSHIEFVVSKNVMPMEMLPINKNSGQSYGFTLYATKISKGAKKVYIYDAVDRITVIVNGVIVRDVESLREKFDVTLPTLKAGDENDLQILVENCGRINYEHALDYERKGIRGKVEVDGKKKEKWSIYPLEFKKEFVVELEESKYWEKAVPKEVKGPALFKSSFYVNRAPYDCILHIEGWERGVVFVNGRNLGRYDALGPQRTLYIPRSFLKSGDNTVIIFESGKPSNSYKINTVTNLIWGESTDFHT